MEDVKCVMKHGYGICKDCNEITKKRHCIIKNIDGIINDCLDTLYETSRLFEDSLRIL